MAKLNFIAFLNSEDPDLKDWQNLLTQTLPQDTLEFCTLSTFPQDGRKILFVSGGDGSLNHAVNELMSANKNDLVEILYFPNGTGNDFSRTVGLHQITKEEIAKLLLTGKTTSTRVAKLDENYFINMGSFGMFAEVTPDVDPNLKGVFGSWSYYFKGLERLTDIESHTIQFTVDGEIFEEENCIGFFVGNGRFSGGGIQVTPQASYLSPSLELFVVRQAPLPTLVSLGLELQRSEPDISNFDVLSKTVKSIEFFSNSPISMSLDGEKMKQKKGTIRLSKGQIQLIIPKS